MDSQSRLVKRLGGGQKRTPSTRWSLWGGAHVGASSLRELQDTGSGKGVEAPGLGGARDNGRCRSGAARYQAIVVLGLQVDCSYHVHPYQALLREVVFLRPKLELAGGLGGFRVLRKGVDTEEALCVC